MIDFTDHFNIMEATGESSPMTEEDVREIIRSEVEKLGISKTGSSAYSVLPTGEGRLGIYEIGHDEKGTAEVGTISLPPGSRIISNPVVAGDVVSFGVQYDDKQGLVRGHVHSLPEGNLKYPFTVKTPSGGMRYKSVMGREDVEQAGDFEEEPIDSDDDGTDIDAEIEDAQKQLKQEIDDIEEEMRQTAQEMNTTIDRSQLDTLKGQYAEYRKQIEGLRGQYNRTFAAEKDYIVKGLPDVKGRELRDLTKGRKRPEVSERPEASEMIRDKGITMDGMPFDV